jgi:hypothetical protein
MPSTVSSEEVVMAVDNKRSVLVGVLIGQAVCEVISIFVPPRAPIVIGAVFGLFFVGVAVLVRRERLAGSVLGALLGLFLLTQYPTWPKHNALQWAGESVAGALALAALVLSCALLIERLRTGRRAEVAQRSR